MLIPSYSKIRYLSIITQIIALAKKDPTYLHKCSLNSSEKKHKEEQCSNAVNTEYNFRTSISSLIKLFL